jgi:hypothetical protein
MPEDDKSNGFFRRIDDRCLASRTQRFSQLQCFLKILHNLAHLKSTQMFFRSDQVSGGCAGND